MSPTTAWSRETQRASCAACTANDAASPSPDPGLSKERAAIVNAAVALLHTVSDCGGKGGEKRGADVLEQIYRDALQEQA